MRSALPLWLFLAGLASAADAPKGEVEQQAEELPRLVRWMMHPTKKGMFVVVPVIDTDPNSGTTVGAMPVTVVMSKYAPTIRQIHAPAVTYNPYFGVTGKYEFFYFPTTKTDFLFRTALSQRLDRELVLDYNSTELFERTVFFNGRFEYNKDSSKRFFGIGPNTPKSGESNYTLDTINYRFSASSPLWEESPLSAGVLHGYEGNDVDNGSINGVPDMAALYPAETADVRERHHNVSFRGYLIYDTRDTGNTTSSGAYGEAFFAGGSRSLLSEYNYYRYGGELKYFLPHYLKNDSEPNFITATRVRYEEFVGQGPFWLKSTMGGKFSHRGYGEGRFYDNGVVIFSAEERCRLISRTLSGIVTSVWLDPFVALGTVFPSPGQIQSKYFHPVFGTALRIVARPQIVVSTDFGFGQEGLKVFLDINYTF